MTLKVISSTFSSFAFFAFVLLSPLASAQSFNEKQAAIEERVNLQIDTYSPQLEVIRSVNQVYDIMFNSNLGSYFSKESGLVRTISLKNYRTFMVEDSDLDGIVSLKMHTLDWPLQFDVRMLVSQKLASEKTIFNELRSIKSALTDEVPYADFEAPEDTFYVPSNVSALANFQNLRSTLASNSNARNRMRAYDSVIVKNQTHTMGPGRIELTHWTYEDGETYSQAAIVLGHSGVLTNIPFFTPEALELSMKFAFNNDIGVLAGYWMKSDEFEAALQEFDILLSEDGILETLSQNNVHNVEFNPDYKHSDSLFQGNKLELGTTRDEMKEVIELLFN